MNIVIVGFMGTGKTEVARKLAETMGLKYVSTDALIEEKETRSINEIFKEDGEAYFRKIEKEVVKELSKLDNVIIDAGGGVMLDKENISSLKNKGIIFCLEAKPEVILKRVKDKDNRPLLNTGDKLQKIKKLLEERMPFYRKADYFIDTSSLNITEVAERIESIFKSIQHSSPC